MDYSFLVRVRKAARGLQDAVRRPDLWRLAPNPLLLTVISLVHTHRGRLPEARALLYEETVDILLWRWEQVKLAGQEGAPLLRQLLLDAGRSEVDLKRILWDLAYEAQSRSQPGEETDLADIGENRLQNALAALKDDDHNWARQVVTAIKQVDKNALEIYPNPVEDILTITSETPVVEVRIYDLAGVQQMVVTGNAISTVNVSSLQVGVYLLSAKDINGNRNTIKVSKK